MRRGRGRHCQAGRPVRGAGDRLWHRLVTRRPSAGGAGRHQHRFAAHEPDRAHQRCRPDGDGAARRHPQPVEQRDPPHRAVLPDRPGRRCVTRRHGRHPGQRHERGALRHHARERAGAAGGDRQRRDHPHRHPRQEKQCRLRPDAPDGGQRGHAGHHHRGDRQALPAARIGVGGDLPLPQHRCGCEDHYPDHPAGRAHRPLRTAGRQCRALRQPARQARIA